MMIMDDLGVLFLWIYNMIKLWGGFIGHIYESKRKWRKVDEFIFIVKMGMV